MIERGATKNECDVIRGTRIPLPAAFFHYFLSFLLLTTSLARHHAQAQQPSRFLLEGDPSFG